MQKFPKCYRTTRKQSKLAENALFSAGLIVEVQNLKKIVLLTNK